MILSLAATRRMIILGVCSLWSINAPAWGPQGHHVVATFAAQQLEPRARLEIQRLLALEPGATRASISTWADENRDKTTARWHYVNLPRASCAYEEARDCPGGDRNEQAATGRVAAGELAQWGLAVIASSTKGGHGVARRDAAAIVRRVPGRPSMPTRLRAYSA